MPTNKFADFQHEFSKSTFEDMHLCQENRE
jgi:hypothetical protein